MERKLAAVLAADVVGYSRLVQLDEEGTINSLKTVRSDLIDPEVTAHRGRIVKLMGDGILVEFPSVVAAVECAVAIQQGMADRTSAGFPELYHPDPLLSSGPGGAAPGMGKRASVLRAKIQ